MMNRREFLKISGLAGSGFLLGACESRHSRLKSYVERPAHLVPGEPTYFASACDLCPAGCGVMVRVVEGRAIKLEGLPDHPVNHGGLCPLGQGGVQHQYHPDRFRGPRWRANRGAVSEETSWEQAINKLADGLQQAQGALAILVGSQVRGHRYGLLAKLAQAFAAPAPLLVDHFGLEAVRAANVVVFGRPEIPTYDLPNTQLLMVFGDDPFTTGMAPTHYSWGYGLFRRGRETIRGQLAVISTRFGEAAAIADLWIPVKPGTHGAIAQALLGPTVTGGISTALAAALTGAPEERIRALVEKFKQIRPAIALGGGEVLGYTNAVATLIAVNSLNVVAGVLGRPGGVLPAAAPPLTDMVPPPPASYRELVALLERMHAGKVKALLLVGSDPFMAFPAAAKLEEALARVPFIASFATLPDDGAASADVILPDSTFLERWGDSTPLIGTGASVATLMQPAILPFFASRAAEDVILEAARGAGHDLGYANAAAYFKQQWSTLAPDKQVPGHQSSWKQVLRTGGIFHRTPGKLPGRQQPSTLAVSETPAVSLTAPGPAIFSGDPANRPFHLLPLRSLKYRQGLAAHLPWLQELADPMSAAAWGGWIEISPQLADKLGVTLYDEVRVESDHGSLMLGVVLYPGLPENVVGVPLAYSRKQGTRYDSVNTDYVWPATQKADPGRGADVRTLLAPVIEERSGGWAWGATRVSITPTGRKAKLTMVSKQIPPQESPILPHRIKQEFKVWPIG
ncbi:MAG: molybdopterin-dependent oxidoreductase [Cyanobacteria bacterium NC_groundwater_1444_Ag_S-0.65um_54_12]|nr:molybdopterin-dependent oxidoreductase [Cyanobacteria bacterium NC_groundwater_1444_Ag_S-0.65um_54_12]